MEAIEHRIAHSCELDRSAHRRRNSSRGGCVANQWRCDGFVPAHRHRLFQGDGRDAVGQWQQKIRLFPKSHFSKMWYNIAIKTTKGSGNADGHAYTRVRERRKGAEHVHECQRPHLHLARWQGGDGSFEHCPL